MLSYLNSVRYPFGIELMKDLFTYPLYLISDNVLIWVHLGQFTYYRKLVL